MFTTSCTDSDPLTFAHLLYSKFTEIWKPKNKTELIPLLKRLSVFCDDKYQYIFFTKSNLTTFWRGWKLSMHALHGVGLDTECLHDACSITWFPYQWN